EALRLVRWPDDAAARQASEEAPAVAAAGDARVEEGHDAAILRGADQPSEPLLERERGLRHLEGGERVLAFGAQLLDARLHQRLPRRGERQLVDDDQAERVTLHVDAFPEALAGKEHAGLVSERLEELRLGPLALQQDLPGQLGREQLVNAAHVAQGSEERERAAACDGQELPQLVRHRLGETLVL